MSGKRKIRRRNKFGSYPSGSVVFSITLALLVAGLFGLLTSFTHQLERLVRDNYRVQVYLRQDVNDSLRQVITKTLTAQDFLNRELPEQQRISYISRDSAARAFIRDTGEDFLHFLGDNPLHDSYLISVAPAFQSNNQLKSVKDRLEKLPGVHLVDYNPNLLDSVNRNRNIIGAVLAGCALLFLALVVLLIRNTIRLALFSQRFLIRSMQLVGATRGFIMRPFLWRAAAYGLAGALLAAGILGGMLAYAVNIFPELGLLSHRDSLFVLLGGMGALGIFVAVSSTWGAMRTYLGLSLDDLY